ncbi:MAG: HNH endonuclease signature motif containing protein [Terriglobales bacterium]
MNADLIRQVWQRARARCEYCQLPSAFHPAPFQIDHIIARQHGGTDAVDNLALACIHCNRFKGPNIAGVDPDSGEIVRLFDPRRDAWTEHFMWDGPELKALTQIGRVTISLLVVNDPEVVTVRKALQEEGVFGV